MRELSPWAIRSNGRQEWREFYASYISSPKWFARREQWAEEEMRLSGGDALSCRADCGRTWSLDRGDLHHCNYDRLGNEAHEDLWALCRACHDTIHRLLDSTRSWRKLDRQLANQQALRILQTRHGSSEVRSGTEKLRGFL